MKDPARGTAGKSMSVNYATADTRHSRGARKSPGKNLHHLYRILPRLVVHGRYADR